VSFRWSRGALATKLRRSPTGWVARVPPGTKAGTISVRVTDRAGRRSRVIRLIVLPVPAQRRATGGPLPAPFAGNGMWIWELPKSDGGDVNAIAARARAAGISTVFVKSSDGPDDAWAQFNPSLVQVLHAYGLHVCACQFVYGADPLGEAAQARAPRLRAPTAWSSTPRAATRVAMRSRSSTSPLCGPRSDPAIPSG